MFYGLSPSLDYFLSFVNAPFVFLAWLIYLHCAIHSPGCCLSPTFPPSLFLFPFLPLHLLTVSLFSASSHYWSSALLSSTLKDCYALEAWEKASSQLSPALSNSTVLSGAILCSISTSNNGSKATSHAGLDVGIRGYRSTLSHCPRRIMDHTADQDWQSRCKKFKANSSWSRDALLARIGFIDQMTSGKLVRATIVSANIRK